jgi:hypothetical protein
MVNYGSGPIDGAAHPGGFRVLSLVPLKQLLKVRWQQAKLAIHDCLTTDGLRLT